uniref:Uncharacterized protein n=1 Tax=Siphoviridae sp. ct6d71 TaxID=2826298 RepID=A0A8S5R360_9CAUD|nr:MAG TPA: hypothetical protein [Siphoviridae sp. ct6d71]
MYNILFFDYIFRCLLKQLVGRFGLLLLYSLHPLMRLILPIL